MIDYGRRSIGVVTDWDKTKPFFRETGRNRIELHWSLGVQREGTDGVL